MSTKHDKGWSGAGMKERQRHEKRMRRDLEAWPRGPAGGGEPIGEVVRRISKNLSKKDRHDG